MKIKNYMQIPLFKGSDGDKIQLSEMVRMSLLTAGYDAKGKVETWNANQVYAQVNEGKDVSAFVGVVRLNKVVGLEVVGDMEYNLDETTTAQLAHASPIFIQSLSLGKKIVNNEWRSKCIANSLAIGRGTVVDIDKSARKITADGTQLSRLVVTDGQKCTAVIASAHKPAEDKSNDNGRPLTFPRKARDVMTPDHSLVNINTFTIPHSESRRIATILAVRDMAVTSGDHFSGNLIPGSKPGRRDGDVLVIYQGGKLRGTVSGDVVDVAINQLGEFNTLNGHRKAVLSPCRKSVVQIDPEKLDKVLERRERISGKDASVDLGV